MGRITDFADQPLVPNSFVILPIMKALLTRM